MINIYNFRLDSSNLLRSNGVSHIQWIEDWALHVYEIDKKIYYTGHDGRLELLTRYQIYQVRFVGLNNGMDNRLAHLMDSRLAHLMDNRLAHLMDNRLEKILKIICIYVGDSQHLFYWVGPNFN